MAAADLLVHPARYDTAGTVILEGIVNGLPVITTAACGYARHVEAANAGSVLKEPFSFFAIRCSAQARECLHRSVVLGPCPAAAKRGVPTLYQGRVRAADLIVEAAFSKASRATILQDQIPKNLRNASRSYSDPVSPSCSSHRLASGRADMVSQSAGAFRPNVNDICSLILMF